MIAIGVVVLLLIGLVGYNIYLRRSVEAPLAPEISSEELPQEEGEGVIGSTDTDSDGFFNVFSGEERPGERTDVQPVTRISEDSVFAATLTSTGDRILYVRSTNGTMHTTSFDGKSTEQKIFTEIPNLTNVQFNGARTKVLLSFASDTDPDGLSHQVLNLETQEFSDLHPNIGEITWDASGERLLYIFSDPTNSYLDISISESDGSRFRSVKNVTENLLTLGMIPNTPFVTYHPKANSYNIADLKAVNIDDGRELLLSEGRYGFDVLWSPDGQRALFFETAEQGGGRVVVSLFHRETGLLEPLNIRTTIDKVVWNADSSSFYAALPDYLGTRYPDDYLSGLLFTRDTFWKIGAENGLVSQLTDGNEVAEDLNATNLFLSPDEKRIFFINQNNRSLYSVNF